MRARGEGARTPRAHSYSAHLALVHDWPRTYTTHAPLALRRSLCLPISRYVSLYLPISPYISCISVHLRTSPTRPTLRRSSLGLHRKT